LLLRAYVEAVAVEAAAVEVAAVEAVATELNIVNSIYLVNL
jgi:hypothetical protein